MASGPASKATSAAVWVELVDEATFIMANVDDYIWEFAAFVCQHERLSWINSSYCCFQVPTPAHHPRFGTIAAWRNAEMDLVGTR